METVKSSGFLEVLIPLLIIMFIIAVGVVLLYQHFQKNLFIHKLRQEAMKSNQQQELLRANILAQEAERKRIAQDIHDELGAALSITRMNMVMLEQQSSEAYPDMLPGLQNVRVLLESALGSVRSISHRLMPPQLEAFGLVKTLESVIAQINKTGQIDFQLQVLTPLADLPRAVSLGLYRIIMELINNTVKHSGASQACVDMDELEGHIVCRYIDNGKGCTPEEAGNGLGHKSINGRISALHGTFEFCTPESGGFCAIIRVPLHTPGNAA